MTTECLQVEHLQFWHMAPNLGKGKTLAPLGSSARARKGSENRLEFIMNLRNEARGEVFFQSLGCKARPSSQRGPANSPLGSSSQGIAFSPS